MKTNRKWEYHWFEESITQEPLETFLDDLGDKGSELVSVVHDGKNLVFFMKRLNE
jgi:hypothetical protein